MKIDIPDRIFGADVNGAMKRILGEENKEQSQPQQNQTPKHYPMTKIPGFIYIPSVDLYFQKEKQFNNCNWHQAHVKLQERGLRMPTIEEFRQFLSYLKYNPSAENTGIYNEITEVRKPARVEWLDAGFQKQYDGLYIITKNQTKEEKLDDYLMENKIPGIDFDEWLNDATKQGLPKSGIKKGDLWYWKPIDGYVSRFYANSSMVCLFFNGSHGDSASNLWVRGVLEGAGAKTK